MELYILDKSYDQIAVIDEFKSLLWVKRYWDFGDCEIYISASETMMNILQRGHFIRRDDDEDMICRIVSVEVDTDEENGNYLIVKALDCRHILNQRVIWKQTVHRGTAENLIRRIINKNFIEPLASSQAEAGLRQISNFKLGPAKGFTDNINFQSNYEPIGEKIVELCKLYGYGSKVKFDGTDFIFNVYKGVNRSYSQNVNDFVVFSPDYENLAKSSYMVDESVYKSVALIGGVGEGNKRHLTTTAVSGKGGMDRYETFVDSSVSNELSYEDLVEQYPNGTLSGTSYSVNGVVIATVELDGENEPINAVLKDAPYNELLQEEGKEVLSGMMITTSFNGEVDPYQSYKYGVDYFLGDIVQVINEYGIEASARITEVIESFDDNGQTIIPTFEYDEVKE